MFNRRSLVALAVCLACSATTVMAGGDGGTKKDSTLRVYNNTDNAAYVFVDVDDQRIQNAANSSTDPQKVFQAFDRLGGKLVQGGENHVDFKVKAGVHTVTAVDVVEAEPIGKQTGIVTTKGETTEVHFPQQAMGT